MRWFTDAGSFPYEGSFDFSTNINNPFDANHPYANLLLGTFNSYSESSSRPVQDIHGLDLQCYAQDTWKATRRLTLNYGMRFLLFQAVAPIQRSRLELYPLGIQLRPGRYAVQAGSRRSG